jgi:hypothetical protein
MWLRWNPMAPTAKSALAGRRIPIGEDEYFPADQFRQVVAARGAGALGPVATLGEGLRIIEGPCQIDFALLDVQLQGQDVFAISAALKSRKIPFRFATGFGPRKFRGNMKTFRGLKSHSSSQP